MKGKHYASKGCVKNLPGTGQKAAKLLFLGRFLCVLSNLVAFNGRFHLPSQMFPQLRHQSRIQLVTIALIQWQPYLPIKRRNPLASSMVLSPSQNILEKIVLELL